MPYIDFGDVHVRKTMHKVTVFLRPEGETDISAALQFDWDSVDVINPETYLLVNEISGAVYGEAIYGVDVYSSAPVPVLIQNVSGSGMSTRITFSSSDTNPSYSIQAVVFEYAVNGRK